MEKRAPSRLMEKGSMFGYDSSFDKMANHVKDFHGGVSRDVSTPKNKDIEMPKITPYQQPDFSFMDKGKKV